MPDRFEIEQKKLLEIIDVAFLAYNKYENSYEPELFKNIIRFIAEYRKHAESPKRRRLSNLNDITQMVLIYFQEGFGPDVDFFWNEIEARRIDLKRVDVLEKILRKKRISNDSEYDFVTDMLVEAQQTGQITEETAELLDHYLGIYEKKHAIR